MKRYNYIIMLMFGLVLIAGLVIAQAGSVGFPPTFNMQLNQLPPTLSENQKFFNCPYYDGSITLRDVKIYNNPTGLTPDVNAQIRYWVGHGKCSASYTKNFTVAPALTSNQLVLNFQTAVNDAFLLEAQSNHQPTTGTPPISSGGGSNTPG